MMNGVGVLGNMHLGVIVGAWAEETVIKNRQCVRVVVAFYSFCL